MSGQDLDAQTPEPAVLDRVHRLDHGRLLVDPDSEAPAPLGDTATAVVVPASRPVGRLEAAARVAAAGGGRLIVLCSGEVTAAEVNDRWAARRPASAPCLAVDLPPGHRLPGDLPVTLNPVGELFDGVPGLPGRGRDTAVKRTLGLLLAAATGHRQVLFLDDDVTDVTRERLHAATAQLGRGGRELAGWDFGEQVADPVPGDRPWAAGDPGAASGAAGRGTDNSLVCQGARLVGLPQGRFVGGGALLAGITDDLPHFPDVYNEDWLFLAPRLALRPGCLVRMGTLRHQERPLAGGQVVAEAARQEFGDVLGEGLFHLLGDRRWSRGAAARGQAADAGSAAGEVAADPLDAAEAASFWAERTAARQVLIRLLQERLAPLPTPLAGALLAAVRAASVAHHPQWAAVLARYVQLWRQDARRWRKLLVEALDLAPEDPDDVRSSTAAVAAVLDRFDLRAPVQRASPSRF